MKILIIGLGLIGGSLAKAFKKFTNDKVYGINRTKSKTEMALKDGSIDAEGKLENEDYDIIWLCQYKTALENWVKEYVPKLKKGTILADVCGLKGDMTERITDYCNSYGIKYVGTHPMAGKEVSGYINSESDLFCNSNFIITPTKGTDKQACELVAQLAKQIGCKKIVYCNPKKHDSMIAYVSQLPHIIASSLMNCSDSVEAGDFSGGSFRDATRVATIDSEMWQELFCDNKAELLERITEFSQKIDEFKKSIESDDVSKLIELMDNGSRNKELELKRF